MIQSALHLSIFGWAVVALLMSALWGIQLFTQNAAIVDFGWALSLVFLASFYAIRGDAGLWRGLLMAGMVGVWGLRLGFLPPLCPSHRTARGRPLPGTPRPVGAHASSHASLCFSRHRAC